MATNNGNRAVPVGITSAPTDRSIPIPLPGSTAAVVVTGPFPLDRAAWEYVIRVLEAMHDGLVKPSDEPEHFVASVSS